MKHFIDKLRFTLTHVYVIFSLIFIVGSVNTGLRIWAAFGILVLALNTLPPRRVHASRYQQLKWNGGKHTEYQWYWLQARQGFRCACCQRKVPLTKDHVIPVSKGGIDHISNIQALCQSCNSSKGTRIIRY